MALQITGLLCAGCFLAANFALDLSRGNFRDNCYSSQAHLSFSGCIRIEMRKANLVSSNEIKPLFQECMQFDVARRISMVYADTFHCWGICYISSMLNVSRRNSLFIRRRRKVETTSHYNGFCRKKKGRVSARPFFTFSGETAARCRPLFSIFLAT